MFQTLKPGLIVSLKTACRGNVRYDKRDLETVQDGETKIAHWETTRTIADAAEYERAKLVQSEASQIIRRVCTWTAFGLLCSESNSDRLEAAIREARALVDSFNESARITRVSIYILAGRVAQDDVEAARAINAEIRELMDSMADGVKNMNAVAIRAAANKAKSLGSLLSPEAESKVRVAIDSARRVARNISKAGETAALEVDRYAIRAITEQRLAFLDLESDAVVQAPEAESRAVDFEADTVTPVVRRSTREIEME